MGSKILDVLNLNKEFIFGVAIILVLFLIVSELIWDPKFTWKRIKHTIENFSIRRLLSFFLR